MQTPKFLIGEIVQLSAGGPLMTICNIQPEQKEELDEHGKVRRPAKKALAFCRWFDGARLAQAPFPFESLICPMSQLDPSLTPQDPETPKSQL